MENPCLAFMHMLLILYIAAYCFGIYCYIKFSTEHLTLETQKVKRMKRR